MNERYARVWKENVVIYLKVLSMYSLGKVWARQKMPQSGYAATKFIINWLPLVKSLKHCHYTKNFCLRLSLKHMTRTDSIFRHREVMKIFTHLKNINTKELSSTVIFCSMFSSVFHHTLGCTTTMQ